MTRFVLHFSALIFISVSLISCNPSLAQPGDEGDFVLTVTDAEESEDSNTETDVYTLAGSELSWRWSYSGYHPDEDFDRDQNESVQLSNAELSALHELVQELELDQEKEVDLTDTAKIRFEYGYKSYVLETWAGGKQSRYKVRATNGQFLKLEPYSKFRRLIARLDELLD